MTFQNIVLTTAILFLILMLIYIGYNIRSASKQVSWPPQTSTCPDYWTDTSTQGGGKACTNTHSLGTCNLPANLFTSQDQTDSTGNDITAYNQVDQTSCQAMCAGNAECGGFVFTPDAEGTFGKCQLKSTGVATAATQPNPAATLFLKNPSGSANSMDFTVAPFVGTGGTCAKYTWAHQCGVTWDGITSGGISNPCATTSS